MLLYYLSGFSFRFQKLSRAHGQVTYVLLTRSPLRSIYLPMQASSVRLLRSTCMY